jgi:hypothetical protein
MIAEKASKKTQQFDIIQLNKNNLSVILSCSQCSEQCITTAQSNMVNTANGKAGRCMQRLQQ